MPEPIRYVTVEGFDGKKSRHKLVRWRGFDGYMIQFAHTCSECSEHIDGCLVSGPRGCRDCGYTGRRRWKVWVPVDPEAFDRHESKVWARLDRLREHYQRKAA